MTTSSPSLSSSIHIPSSSSISSYSPSLTLTPEEEEEEEDDEEDEEEAEEENENWGNWAEISLKFLKICVKWFLFHITSSCHRDVSQSPPSHIPSISTQLIPKIGVKMKPTLEITR